MKKRIIEHNLNFFTMDQDLFEPDEIFADRINYVIKNLGADNFDNLVKKSRLLVNIEIYGCEYNENITNMLQQ